MKSALFVVYIREVASHRMISSSSGQGHRVHGAVNRHRRSVSLLLLLLLSDGKAITCWQLGINRLAWDFQRVD